MILFEIAILPTDRSQSLRLRSGKAPPSSLPGLTRQSKTLFENEGFNEGLLSADAHHGCPGQARA
jgi:hypothetical protein